MTAGQTASGRQTASAAPGIRVLVADDQELVRAGFCGIIAACWRLNMGMLAIRVLAGGPLASSRRAEGLAVLTSDTDLDNEMRASAAVRAALGPGYDTPAQVALRFTLGNRDVASRVVGFAELHQINEALAAVERGPLPPEAVAKLDQLWANDFYVPTST